MLLPLAHGTRRVGGRSSTPPALVEAAHECLADFCVFPGFLQEAYAGLDCRVECSNLFEDVTKVRPSPPPPELPQWHAANTTGVHHTSVAYARRPSPCESVMWITCAGPHQADFSVCVVGRSRQYCAHTCGVPCLVMRPRKCSPCDCTALCWCLHTCPWAGTAATRSSALPRGGSAIEPAA